VLVLFETFDWLWSEFLIHLLIVGVNFLRLKNSDLNCLQVLSIFLADAIFIIILSLV
jgi:hypothetical protein